MTSLKQQFDLVFEKYEKEYRFKGLIGIDLLKKDVLTIVSPIEGEVERLNCDIDKRNGTIQSQGRFTLSLQKEIHELQAELEKSEEEVNLSKKLCWMLMNYVGETGQSESAVETLARKLAELKNLKAENEKLRETLEEIKDWSEGCYCMNEEEASKAGGKTCPNCIIDEALGGK